MGIPVGSPQDPAKIPMAFLQGNIAELNQKEEEISNKLMELTTKDFYLEAYSRQEIIKFNYIPHQAHRGQKAAL